MQKIKQFLSDNKYIILMLAVSVVYVFVLRDYFGIIAAPLEIIAIVFAIIEFDLFRREKSSAFIFNVIKCVLLIFWFLSIELYGQVAFRSLFAVLNLVGLFIWLFPKYALNKKELNPTWLPRKIQALIYSGVFVFGLIMLAFSNTITTMDWVYVACGTIGNIFIAFKKTDAWVLWLITDLIGIPLFFLTGSWMYLLITVFMVFIEIAALKSWNRAIKK